MQFNEAMGELVSKNRNLRAQEEFIIAIVLFILWPILGAQNFLGSLCFILGLIFLLFSIAAYIRERKQPKR